MHDKSFILSTLGGTEWEIIKFHLVVPRPSPLALSPCPNPVPRSPTLSLFLSYLFQKSPSKSLTLCPCSNRKLFFRRVRKFTQAQWSATFFKNRINSHPNKELLIRKFPTEIPAWQHRLTNYSEVRHAVRQNPKSHTYPQHSSHALPARTPPLWFHAIPPLRKKRFTSSGRFARPLA